MRDWIIASVPFTGEHKLFLPNVDEETLKRLKDEHGDIRFKLVFEWLQMTFRINDVEYFEVISAQMCNYMLHIRSKSNLTDHPWD